MYVDIGRPRAYGLEQLRQVASGETLRWNGPDVLSRKRPRDCPGGRWAVWSAATPAQENSDTPGGRRRAQMDMGNECVRFKTVIAQLEGDRLSVVAYGCCELAARGAGQGGGSLLIASERGGQLCTRALGSSAGVTAESQNAKHHQ